MRNERKKEKGFQPNVAIMLCSERGLRSAIFGTYVSARRNGREGVKYQELCILQARSKNLKLYIYIYIYIWLLVELSMRIFLHRVWNVNEIDLGKGSHVRKSY